jgi:uncharacterized protein (UPF0333 family)
MKNLFKELFFDKKGQVSVELLLLLGIIILAALAVGFYLKQTSIKHASDATKLQTQSVTGSQ